MYGRETNDIYYTSLLPMKKRNTVKAILPAYGFSTNDSITHFFASCCIKTSCIAHGKPAGIKANIAYYGFGFMICAIFNLILLTQFFKTTYKVGKAFILAIIPAAIGVLIMKVLVHIPKFQWLDSVEPDIMLKQLPILVIGIIIYIFSMLVAYRVSANRFQQVDL